MIGTVKWFDSKKGYGFISPDEGGKDIFVHHTAIDMAGYRQLTEGQKVEYIAVDGSKGPQAADVKSLEDVESRKSKSTTNQRGPKDERTKA